MFFVPGIPKPGGSKKGFIGRKTGKVHLVDTCDNRDWKTSVKAFAYEALGSPIINKPIAVTVEFRMPRPKHHYNSKRELKTNAPVYHTSKPDATKLFRALEDALTGVAWDDDSRVADQYIKKVYSDQPGAVVTIWELE